MKTRGAVSTRLCRCGSEPTWMKLVEEPLEFPDVSSFYTPLSDKTEENRLLDEATEQETAGQVRPRAVAKGEAPPAGAEPESAGADSEAPASIESPQTEEFPAETPAASERPGEEAPEETATAEQPADTSDDPPTDAERPRKGRRKKRRGRRRKNRGAPSGEPGDAGASRKEGSTGSEQGPPGGNRKRRRRRRGRKSGGDHADRAPKAGGDDFGSGVVD